MKKILKYSFFLLSQLTLIAQEYRSFEFMLKEAYDQGAILGYHDGKVYLNSSSLIFDDKDWVLSFENDLAILLPAVSVDSLGFFIPYYENANTRTQLCSYAKVTNTCPTCNREYFYRCETPSCLEKRNKILQEHKESQKQKTKDYKDKKSQESKDKKKSKSV
jgi:hypothetical protein